ncbi:MAG: hypothetical protein AVDCRST_MAG34-2160, partial [uncultured Nocardioidaceae bacterium]
GLDVHRPAHPPGRRPAGSGLRIDRRLPRVAEVVAVGGRRSRPAARLLGRCLGPWCRLQLVREPEGRQGAHGDRRRRRQPPRRPRPLLREAVHVREPHQLPADAGRGRDRRHLADDRYPTAPDAAGGAVARHGQAGRQGLREGPGSDGSGGDGRM